MQVFFSDSPQGYDGSQLTSHFAYQNFGILGDSAIAFVGPCEVSLAALVDLEDVRRKAPIYSPEMLHFIVESFHLDLRGAVFLQRLFMAAIAELLLKRGVSTLTRAGDDLYDGEKKLSVSIATASPVSTLIHVGLNIRTEGTPVPTQGLADWGIDAVDFARECLEMMKQEYEACLKASYKVRGVP